MTREIVSDGTVFALIADVSDVPEGIHPLTDPAWPLQVLMRKHGKGHRVAKHAHKALSRTATQLNEGLVVIAGTLRVRIFDAAGKDIGVYDISPGQCLLMLTGGHEVEVIEDAIVYEFKNGPYHDDKIPLQ
jgi:hypothetical protein